MKKALVTVIYDNSRPVGSEIKQITGKRSFGEAVFKRKTLRERTEELLKGIETVGSFADRETIPAPGPTEQRPVFVLFSDFMIRDRRAVEILLEKCCYADEPYRVLMQDAADGERCCAALYPSLSSYLETDEEALLGCDIIRTEAFIDISNIGNFRQFITSGFDARFFNSLSGDEYVVVKSSRNKEKIRAEYEFYRLLPEDMRMWFATAFDYKETDEGASYAMERFHFTDVAIRYVHGAIDEEEFSGLLDRLFHFIGARKKKAVSREEYEEGRRYLYVDKVRSRIEALKKNSEFRGIEELIRAGTRYSGIDEIADRYFTLYEELMKEKSFEPVLVIGHGDLCFSNILYNKDADILKLIDPRGALDEGSLYMDPFYDLCKLSHSICGSYDYFNSGLFEISLSEDNRLVLSIDSDNESYISLFKNKLSENGFDIRLIRLLEASLFLSMLPLHIDRKKKVLGFILNADRILEEIWK